MIEPPDNDPGLMLQTVGSLTPRAVEWFWPGRLPLGKLAILDGDPGLGKSLVALDLCARLSTGRPLPDGSSGPGVVSSIVLNAEDNAEDTVRPRLRALGADLERTFVLHRNQGAGRELLRFPSQIASLAWALSRTGARVVVIDPVKAFLDPNVNDANDQSIRQALYPLIALGEQSCCVILLIRHLNKSRSFHALYRGGGSIGIVGMCRAALLVARDPQDSSRCILAQVKNNLGAIPPSLAYRIEGPSSAEALIAWEGPCSWAADQLLAAGPPPGPTARDRARDFLSAALAEGPRNSRELWAAAQKERLSLRTLERAKRELKIRSERIHLEGKCRSYWALPHQEMPAGAGGESAKADATPEFDEYIADLEEKYPPSTPLDDL